MDTKARILQWAKSHSPFKSQALVKHLGISRQNTAAHLTQLVDAGKLQKEGSTRNATYSIPNRGSRPMHASERTVVLHKKLKGLEEDLVYQELDRKLELRRQLGEKTHGIVAYAFTEMLNNAIDHSASKNTKILFTLSRKEVIFSIRDFGIGAYYNIQSSFRLRNEFDALEHLFKGKQTTAPDRHSGEGIFFTSKIADRFSLRSHQLAAIVDNTEEDIFVREDRNLKGTLVEFRLRRRTKKSLSDLFRKFSNRNFEFDKNEVSVKLSREGNLLSRSQAKRLLNGLEKYRRIVFDFKGVKDLGQGFADEVFRVFQRQHPEIQLSYVNAGTVVEMMVRRAKAPKA